MIPAPWLMGLPAPSPAEIAAQRDFAEIMRALLDHGAVETAKAFTHDTLLLTETADGLKRMSPADQEAARARCERVRRTWRLTGLPFCVRNAP